LRYTHIAKPANLPEESGNSEKDSTMKHLRHWLTVGAFMAGLLLGAGAVAQASERLALKGYDPVAYFTEQRPMKGEPQLQHEWGGAVYRFASAKHLELFKANPDRYLPQYSNLCAASVAKGIKVQGQPEYWLVQDGRLYLFGGPQGPDLMRANAAVMKSSADRNFSAVSLIPGHPK
jgi:YHS domain-containing protein